MATDVDNGPAGIGARRLWLVAVAFGVLSSAALATVVLLASRSSDTSDPTAASTSAPTTATGAADVADARPRVAIVGDSITEQGSSTLMTELSERWQLDVDGRSGFTVAEQRPAAEDLAEDGPVQVIVNLGTNDVTKGTDIDRAAADLAEVVAVFPDAACVHLVTVNEGIAGAGGAFGPRAAELNRSMDELAAGDPRVDVIDWSAVVAASDAPEQILRDTVHPTGSGQQVLAGLYRDALLAGCDGP